MQIGFANRADFREGGIILYAIYLRKESISLVLTGAYREL